MRLALVALVVLATSLDTATYYRLPLVGSAEANPIVVHLGAVAVAAKLLVGASVAWAVRRRLPWFQPAAVILVGWWGFGAWVNSL